jgi:cytochrome c peroxidase
LSFVIFSCGNKTQRVDREVSYRVPNYFPALNLPEDNLPTLARMELGKKLFYDIQLSKNKSHHCGSCHVLSAAFTDGKQVSSLGDNNFKRNSPTLANLAWSPYLMAEGGVPSLEKQALAPIHESHELNLSMEELIDRLSKQDEYQALSMRAYQRGIDAFVVTRALACFQRSFISGDSEFDRNYYLNQSSYSEEEKRGQELFFSERTKCSSCHTPPLFTNFEFASLGIEDFDPGLERKTYQATDFGKFKTPTLRNVELTGPYMHNGSFSTLEEVIEFYNKGGGMARNKSDKLNVLDLSKEDKMALVAFLKTLTDWNFVQNAALQEN